MRLAEELTVIRNAPHERLTEPSVLALGAFLFGYKMADAGPRDLLTEAAARYPGKTDLDAASLAYLSHSNTQGALEKLVELLFDLGANDVVPLAGPGGNMHVVDLVRTPIASGKTGMVLLEPTVTWLANYTRGHTAGLEALQLPLAKQQAASFERFERQLREDYAHPAATWHAILRVYEGADLHGLKRFLDLWDQCFAQRPSA